MKKKALILLLIAVIFFCYEVLSYAYIRVLPTYLGAELDRFFYEHESLSNGLFALLILVLLLPVFLLLSRRKSREPFVSLSSFSANDLLRGVILVIGSYGITSLWFYLLDALSPWIPFLQESAETFETLFTPSVPEPYLVLLFDIVFIGPFMEEVYMRGLIGGLLKKAFPFWAVVLLNGLLFGLFHMNFVQGVYTAVFGAFICALYLETKSLSLAILLHMFHNFLSTLPEGAYSEAFSMFLDKFSLLFVPFALYLFIQMLRKGTKKEEELQPFLE